MSIVDDIKKLVQPNDPNPIPYPGHDRVITQPPELTDEERKLGDLGCRY